MNLTRASLALIVIIPFTATPAHAATVWREDFTTPGRWPSSVSVYSGGHYRPAQSLTVHDGVLDAFLFNTPDPSKPSGWDSVASAIVPAVNGRYLNTRYGQYDLSVFVDRTSGGLVGWNFVALLWPENNNPAGGEYDAIEHHFGGPMETIVHETGARHRFNCRSVPLGPGLVGWHHYSFQWNPQGFAVWIDGQLLAWVTCGQPLGRMHLVIQMNADGGLAPGNSFGHVLIDSLQVAGI